MSEQKKYIVLSNDLHEYTIITNLLENGDTEYNLFYSKGEHWNDDIRGVKALTIIDGDLEMVIPKHDGRILQYHVVDQTRLLLNFIFSHYPNDKYEIIDATNPKIIE